MVVITVLVGDAEGGGEVLHLLVLQSGMKRNIPENQTTSQFSPAFPSSPPVSWTEEARLTFIQA